MSLRFLVTLPRIIQLEGEGEHASQIGVELEIDSERVAIFFGRTGEQATAKAHLFIAAVNFAKDMV